MSDIFEDETSNTLPVPEPEAGPASEEIVDVDDEDIEDEDTNSTMDDFVNTEAAPDLGVDANKIVTVRTSSGQSNYVAVDGPTTLRDIKLKSGLTYAPGTQIFLNNTVVNDDTVIPEGSTLVAIGSVKGGTF